MMHTCINQPQWVNTLRPGQNGGHFGDSIFTCISFRKRYCIFLQIQVCSKRSRNSTLVQAMAWCSVSDQPLAETMITDFNDTYITEPECVNSLWPSDAIWRDRSMSTLAHVMAWCLMAPSHYMNQCWLIISQVCYSHKSNFIGIAQDVDLGNKLVNCIFLIIFPSARGQWVSSLRPKQCGQCFAEDTCICIYLFERQSLSISIEICSLSVHQFSIGSGNDLVPNRWETNIWTSNDHLDMFVTIGAF